MNQINYCNGKDCSRCGECCAFSIPITRVEEKRIRDYIEENNVEKENLFFDDNFYCKCCFYDKQKKVCKIYPVRPNICRTYQCNRKSDVLEKERDLNHQKAYWNNIDKDGKLQNLTSFDLLFYKDPIPLLTLLHSEFAGEDGSMSLENFNKMKGFMYDVGLKDLADSLNAEYE